MADQEKVIKGLECCKNSGAIATGELGISIGDACYTECPYSEKGLRCHCMDRLADDIIALLKAQQPRVMTLEEVMQHNNQDGCVWFEQPTYNAVAAFVIKDDKDYTEIISPYLLGEPINHGYMANRFYGKAWRCWTSRPDEKVMAETPWEAQ